MGAAPGPLRWASRWGRAWTDGPRSAFQPQPRRDVPHFLAPLCSASSLSSAPGAPQQHLRPSPLSPGARTAFLVAGRDVIRPPAHAETTARKAAAAQKQTALRCGGGPAAPAPQRAPPRQGAAASAPPRRARRRRPQPRGPAPARAAGGWWRPPAAERCCCCSPPSGPAARAPPAPVSARPGARRPSRPGGTVGPSPVPPRRARGRAVRREGLPGAGAGGSRGMEPRERLRFPPVKGFPGGWGGPGCGTRRWTESGMGGVPRCGAPRAAARCPAALVLRSGTGPRAEGSGASRTASRGGAERPGRGDGPGTAPGANAAGLCAALRWLRWENKQMELLCRPSAGGCVSPGRALHPPLLRAVLRGARRATR